jgi:RNA polymerase sigma factor (sigma-70 family)
LLPDHLSSPSGSKRRHATTRGEWFAEHILPHEPKVRAWLGRAGWSGDEIEDLIQESYAKLAACHFEAIHNAGGFFFQTARNTAAAIVRRRRIISIRTISDVDKLGTADPALNPEEELTALEDLMRLKDAIESLPTACRRVFVLHKIDGFSQRDTAEHLGISESNVEKHVARGIRHCAAALTRPLAQDGLSRRPLTRVLAGPRPWLTPIKSRRPPHDGTRGKTRASLAP